jgi:sugar lactone lactonase YvrE
VDPAGNLFVTELYGSRIRKITPAGVVTTFAGSGVQGSADGTGTAATFNYPSGIAIDGSGNLFVADELGNIIRKITPGAVVSTFAGSGIQGSANGTGTAATFHFPVGLAIDAAGNLYVGEEGNDNIRKITPAGVVTTLAGAGTEGHADGTGAAASFRNPWGLGVDGVGNVYVGDTYNSLIRRITPAGVVTTFAGNAVPGAIEGKGILASFSGPIGIVFNSSGDMYVADMYNHKIRKIIAH